MTTTEHRTEKADSIQTAAVADSHVADAKGWLSDAAIDLAPCESEFVAHMLTSMAYSAVAIAERLKYLCDCFDALNTTNMNR